MTKYKEGDVLRLPTGQLVYVGKAGPACICDCYFQMKYSSCHYMRPKLLNTELACKELIPNDCCFKLIKEGV